MFPSIGSVISMGLCLFALSYTAEALRRDSVWTIKLTPTVEYEGDVEIVAVFKDGQQHSITLPTTKYENGRQATFKVGLRSAGPLQMVFARTHGVCPIGLLPLKVFRLRQIELESVEANTTYTKNVKDLAIKDSCQSNKSLGSSIKDFDEFNPSYCLVDKKKYADGEQFAMGCVATCTCRGGMYGCVDMCPPIAWSPERKCHFVHVPGQCCDEVRCEEDQQMNSCDAPVTTTKSTGGTRPPPPVRRYPWSVLLCMDTKCSQVHGGIIIGSRHILTYSHDLSSSKDLRFVVGQYIAGESNGSDFSPLRVVNVTAHPDFVNADSPIADSASRLQLLQVDQMFTFDKEIQAANLPFNKNQCGQLTKEGCPLMTVGWDRTDDQDNEIRQWFLHAERTKPDQSACSGKTVNNTRDVVPGPKRRGDRRVCVSGLTRSDCTGPLGGAVAASRGPIDFLVGILDPDSALFACHNQGTAAMLPLCKYVDWISSVTTAGNF